MAFNIESIPNQAGKPAILLRQAWREGKRVRKRTIANLPEPPPTVTGGFRAVLKGAVAVTGIGDLPAVERSLPHGHVAAVLGTARDLGLERILHRTAGRERRLALAAIVPGVISPDSKLATARRLSPETATDSLGALLGLGAVTGNGMPGMPGWLLARQPWTGRSLASRHLKGGSTLILYDVSGPCLEGRCCPLAAFGHNRDGKKGRMRITYGLPVAADGCPVAVEVFAGNTSDPSTVAPQVRRIRRRFGIDRVAPVGDRGMPATARIREDLEPAGPGWIPSLERRDIRKPLERGADAPAPLEPEAPGPDAVAETAGPDFPGGRLMACPSPRLREERAGGRGELLEATGGTLERTAASVRPGRLKDRRTVDRRVGRDASRRKVAKHSGITVTDGGISWRRREDRIAAEARPGGVHLIRTSLDAEAIGTEAAVEAYKSLATVERAFRNAKGDLRIRPVHVYSADHVRGHVFLCMLALYVEWHMRRRLAPVLSGDDDRERARAQRNSPVEAAEVPEGARAKASRRRTADGLPVHSLRTLLADLSTVVLNQLRLPGQGDSLLPVITTPTALRKRAFQLLGVRPDQQVPIRMTAATEPVQPKNR